MAQDKTAPSAQTGATPATTTTPSELRQIVDLLLARNPGELDKLGISRERQLRLVAPQHGRSYRRIPCVGAEGAKFLAVVASDPSCKEGIVVRFENYKYPEGMLRHRAAGGLVPDGLQIARNRDAEITIALLDKTGGDVPPIALTFHYTQWKLNTFYRADQDAMHLKPLKAHCCDPAGKGLDTPWDEPVAHAAE